MASAEPGVRQMVTVEYKHESGQMEKIVTDDPTLLGMWIKHMLSKLPRSGLVYPDRWFLDRWELRG